MKIKNLIYSTVLAMIAVGCSSDEVLLTPEAIEKPISFNAFTNNLTRVGNNYSSNDLPKSFKVWAYVVGSNPETKYIDGVQVNDNSDTDVPNWVPTTTSTWPMYNLDFYAFVDDDTKANGKQVVDYEIKSTVADQLDLMYAVSPGYNENSAGGKVNLSFCHALSQICFTAQNNDPNASFTITGITIKGVKGKGTFTPPTSTSTSAGGNWVTSGEDVNYNIAGSFDLGKPSEGETTGTTVYISVAAQGDENKGRAMNLIPQEGTMTLEVNLTSNNATILKSTEIAIAWKPGMRYIYSIEIQPGGEIGFTTSVVDYGTGDTDVSDDKQKPSGKDDDKKPGNDDETKPGDDDKKPDGGKVPGDTGATTPGSTN